MTRLSMALALLVCPFLCSCAGEDARMEECRTSPDYTCMIESALVMTARAPPSTRDGSYQMIVKAQARLGDTRGALASLDRMTVGDADEDVFRGVFEQDARGIVAAMQAKLGDVEGALATAERFGVVRGAGPAIALVQQAAGDAEGAARTLDRALEAADTIRYGNQRPVALVRIATFAEKTGDAEHVLRAVSMVRQHGDGFFLNDGAIIGAASALTGVGETRIAAEIVSAAQESAASFGGPIGSALVLPSVALAWTQTGDTARAEETMLLAESTTPDIDLAVQLTAGFTVAAGWADIGRRDEALEMVDVIVESAGDATIDDRLGSFCNGADRRWRHGDRPRRPRPHVGCRSAKRSTVSTRACACPAQRDG